MLLVSEKLDSSGFYMYELKKVRVKSILEEGIVVRKSPEDKKLGFIPYCYLNKPISDLYEGMAIYVTYLGQHENYILFGEGTFEEVPDKDILDYNRFWMHEQKILEEYRTKVISHFNDLIDGTNEKSKKILKELLITYDPMDVANAISKVASSYTADLGFINMVKDSLGKELI